MKKYLKYWRNPVGPISTIAKAKCFASPFESLTRRQRLELRNQRPQTPRPKSSRPQSLLKNSGAMASSFLLRRRVSSLGVVSRSLHGNMEHRWLHLESRIEALVILFGATRKFSSGTGTTKFDFTDLTPELLYQKACILREIENGGKHLCSVVYGSLPPETRTRQATMFNDASSDFDVLVASDAIGMGLNLNISRIIFSTMKKFDGIEMRDLMVPEIKQIAGRAGRYGSKFPVGKVTCIDAEDLPLLHSSLESPSPTLELAGLFPTFDLMYLYSRVHPTNSLHQILEHFLDNAKLSENYFIADCEEMLKVAAVIDELPLGLHDKYLFCISPVDMNDEISSQGLTQFAQNYANKGIVRLREIFTPGTLQVPKTQTALKELESVHKVLDLYVWLSFRLEDSFPDHELASSQKAICNLVAEAKGEEVTITCKNEFSFVQRHPTAFVKVLTEGHLQPVKDFLEGLRWQRTRARRLPPCTRMNSQLSKDI
ncbi:dexh-box atp-dependent rna helicase dexh16 [Quercus suber]|uniref:Dexh-box atp-dependent rna helicase dexh16 n=1 Tax=Quercus suber TaxID=58331 RepID=A0AAW0IYS9_QUESU